MPVVPNPWAMAHLWASDSVLVGLEILVKSRSQYHRAYRWLDVSGVPRVSLGLRGICRFLVTGSSHLDIPSADSTTGRLLAQCSSGYHSSTCASHLDVPSGISKTGCSHLDVPSSGSYQRWLSRCSIRRRVPPVGSVIVFHRRRTSPGTLKSSPSRWW
ncbi:hypothetical protein AVEN_158440-1 [Araneus ventricosus]|uniref:Uncharacterized protein n=1 Tax=Araneus ventricosus TaxID=182803 RepID=A0A4Y2S752_ARAVE|nr:hypothetical protein AVEN_158440-1 [Araneus ventricosus]